MKIKKSDLPVPIAGEHTIRREILAKLSPKLKPKEPETSAEWQEAADCAEGALALDSARKYGLVTGGPKVNVKQCENILIGARRLGIRPRPDSIYKFGMALAAEAMIQKAMGKLP
jgi:hypothetical protein